MTSGPRATQSVANLGFETVRDVGGRPLPLGWKTSTEGYEVTVDTTQRAQGRASLRSRATGSARSSGGAPPFGLAAQAYPVHLALGRTLRLTGWIRTESYRPPPRTSRAF